MRFKAFHNDTSKHPVIAVDLGYSERRKSCGVAWKGECVAARFGDAIRLVADALRSARDTNPILVIEAPLSCCHDKFGNPVPRGEFEKGRGWYYQPAATVCLAAFRFLDELAQRVNSRKQLLVAEAFLSNKSKRQADSVDAQMILDGFWATVPVTLNSETKPLSPLIDIAPSVRVFK